MIPLSQPTKIVESKNNRGIFVIEDLYPGYGVTVGNSLRRVLLSSLEGAAVTKVKIKGVDHEFSTLPGLMEDIVSVLLQLKQLRFHMHAEEPQKATLKVKGEKEITGADFELPTQLELLNQDLVLAHLTEKSAELELEIQVEKGVGYVPAEEQNKEKQDIGTIVLDAIFTPIKRVSSRVENMRVGDRTDFNRVTIEVETDGTQSPEQAFFDATDILLKEFQIVQDGVKGALEAQKTVRQKEEPKEDAEKPKKAAKKSVKKTVKK